MHLQRLKISEYRGNIANEDYEAEYLSRPAAVLAGAAPNPPATKSAESNDLYSAFSISEKNIRIEKMCRQRSLSSCCHLSRPAAAPVLAGAAPKPNPPAIKHAESKEPHHVCAISAKKRIFDY